MSYTLAQTLLGSLRRKDLPRSLYRQHAHQLALCMAQQAADQLETGTTAIQTPMGNATVPTFKDPLILVPILRSGLVLLPAFIEYFPDAAIGCLGMKRDEKTAIPHLYYQNMPPMTGEEQMIILDPMLATGGSLLAALEIITKMPVQPKRLMFVGIIGSQQGVAAVKKAYPHLTMLITHIDPHLNDKKFIVPGLGDFGDRFFGTE
jgi:uracil phosphoribosyltransferase